MNDEIKKIDIWLQANCLVKRKPIIWCFIEPCRIKTKSNEIRFTDNKISRVFSTHILEIIIDDQLNWLEHIQYIRIRNKVSTSVGILCKVQM